MSNIKVHGKLRLYVSFLEYGRHVGQVRRRRRAYAPTSNTASQDSHEKINSWVSFIFPLHDEYGAPLGGPSGRRSSAIIIFNLLTSGDFCQKCIFGHFKRFSGWIWVKLVYVIGPHAVEFGNKLYLLNSQSVS